MLVHGPRVITELVRVPKHPEELGRSTLHMCKNILCFTGCVSALRKLSETTARCEMKWQNEPLYMFSREPDLDNGHVTSWTYFVYYRRGRSIVGRRKVISVVSKVWASERGNRKSSFLKL